jgi:hypothetical protein
MRLTVRPVPVARAQPKRPDLPPLRRLRGPQSVVIVQPNGSYGAQAVMASHVMRSELPGSGPADARDQNSSPGVDVLRIEPDLGCLAITNVEDLDSAVF